MKKILIALCCLWSAAYADSWHPPKNFLLSTGPTQALNTFSSQLSYWSINSFDDGRFGVAWPDNSTVSPSQTPNQLNLYARTGNIHKKCSKECKGLKVRLNDVVPVVETTPATFARNVATTVNPVFEGNVVVTFQMQDLTIASNDPNRRQLWRAVSFDGGETFPLVGRIFNLPNVIVDTISIVDEFGNIWLTYVTGPLTDPGANPRTLILAVSSDGGISFTQVLELVPPAAYPVGYDIPTMAFGGDGNGGTGLWLAPTLIDGNFDVTPTLAFFPVTGLGEYDTGHLQTVIYTSLKAFDWEPSIAVSKHGDVFLASVESSAATQGGNDGIKFLRKLDGINNLVPSNIEGPTIIQQRFIQPYANPPFLIPDSFTFLTVCPDAIVYNDKCKSLHVIFTDLLGPSSPDYGVYLITSYDGGDTWQPRVLVSDTTSGPRGLHASIALDRKSKGDLFASWWDARNDPTGLTVEMFGAVIPACKFHCKKHHCHKAPGIFVE